ncbi:(-)-isopiperitenol/(-)-carveol dehydrogenase, mitochondrial-like [Cynara cardunculus var. scolymus]|uniref:Glucose/ribitol dehydrogenase n=1 Tax=Cynara cardunculus var. scolymus TaxID=59895 RepID=A0A103XXV5_CYNCS|nr:(-)-isopiperitenol/(-)-carveol dehydrogenase, mitochondrial-like [Cynara cardunculus var. scolymus]KVH98882.1 Glucose/ribitol dehydrogenase [Cynara cardunculus var. scolymus]
MAEPVLKLDGKISIITGGAGGIGEATARLFANHGAFVIIADIQDEQGRQVADSIGSQRCTYIHCDVADEQQVISAINFTVDTYGRLDIMFSNAGKVSSSDQTVLDLDLPQFDSLFAVNCRGTAVCVKHAARAMVEKSVRGCIICTASVAASRGGSMRTDYVMAKHAVVGLVRSASKQLGVHGIRVNCVSPSAVVTGLSKRTTEETKKTMKVYEALTSLKGIELTVRRVAEAVLFLASDDSSFITGHDLAVDGGLQKLPDVDDVIMYNR